VSGHNCTRTVPGTIRTDLVPDGIERAEPTLAPWRNRLTPELAKGRIYYICNWTERRADRWIDNWDSFYLLIDKDVKPFFNIPRLTLGADWQIPQVCLSVRLECKSKVAPETPGRVKCICKTA
jgi:hypothetical protein